MLFFKRKKQEIRADTDKTSILTFFGITGEITRESAMNIPTVSACINKIGETVSRLPIKLYRRKNESISEIKNDSRIKILNCETGDTLSPVDMWKAAAEDYFLGGGAWIFVNSDSLKVRSIHYVDSRNISIISNNDPIFRAFRVLVNGIEYYDFRFVKLLRKTRDGFTNIPIQQENSRILSAAYNSLMLENMMNSNGGCKPGFLKSKNKLSNSAIAAIKEGYRKVYDNQETQEKILVLNDGVEFEPVSSTAAELQMNENKKTNSIEICKLFGFPHTIIDGGANDDDNKKFISAIIAFLNQVETELDRVLLLESEKEQGFYFAFDTKELTRGNVLERYQAYEIARRNNILQIDEIRREEDFKPLNFDFLTLNLSDVLINPQTMEVFTPNTGQSKNLITGEQRAELRSQQWVKGEHGYFAGSVSTGGGGSSGGGGNSAKTVDKSEKSGIIKSGIPYLDSKPQLEKHSINDCYNTVNPHQEEGLAYQMNCQRCVVAYEARRRGFDVTAKPALLGDEPLKHSSNEKGWANVFEGGKDSLHNLKGNTSKEIKDSICSEMAKYGDGARAVIEVHSPVFRGHVIIAEQFKNKTHFIDPQTSERNVEYIFDLSIISDRTKMLRIDNKNFTSLVEECVE